MIVNEIKEKLKTHFLMYVLLFFAGVGVYYALILASAISRAYLWILLPSTLLGVLGYLEYKRIEKQELLSRMRKEWGVRELEKERDFKEIADLFVLAPRQETVIDDRTWHDLNMDIIYSRMDRTFTWPGCQRLYQILRTPATDDGDEVEARKRAIAEFENNTTLRENLQTILSKMDGRIGSGLSFLLWGKPEVRLVYPMWIYRIMFVVALLSPLLLVLGARYVTLILVIFQINMYLHFKAQKQIKGYFEGVRSLGQLIRTSNRLASLRSNALDGLLTTLRTSLAETRHFTKIVRFVGIETTDPFMHMFYQYFAIFFLGEVRGFYRALSFIDGHRQALQDLFVTMGELDALQSVASYRASLDYCCEPQFTKNRVLQLEDAYHPLLSDPVPNSITVQDRGVLITGSNMSGKSTFLRTVGVNALMAQTVGTCTAKKYVACPVRLLTSIGRADNVVEGKSYYLEEALGVLRILEAINEEMVTLVIFDELYRGTNSEERLFAAHRVLEYLVSRNALVFVATHDLELTNLLADTYTCLHFSERVGQLGLEFDYTLKKGPATSKNAIALLRYLGYPEEITNQEGQA